MPFFLYKTIKSVDYIEKKTKFARLFCINCIHGKFGITILTN